jgi:hypothetical protein
MQLELPRKLNALIEQAHLVATEVFRPISRKYDRAEHEYPVELDMLASVMDGMNEADSGGVAGAGQLKQERVPKGSAVRNGNNMATVLGLAESRTKSSASASRVAGPRWRSPSPPQVPTRRTSAPRPCAMATTT